MSNLGNIPWLATQGRLSTMQRWQIVLRAVGRRLLARRPRAPAPGPAPALAILAPNELDGLAPPQTTVTLAAHSVATQSLPEWLHQHSLRTYLWARLLALGEGKPVDPATLYAACLLHDLGLTSRAGSPPGDCFAVRGARAVRPILLMAGASPQQAETIAAAIALHLDPDIPAARGAEARFLHAGAGFDVLGARFAEVPPPLRQAVIARHPRLDMKTELCRCMRTAADQAPETRIGLYVRHLRFLPMIRKAPFDE